MAFEFLATGQYKVILGKSFDPKPKKKAPKYFNIKNKASNDSHAYGNEAKLEKKKDKYQVEMKHSNGPNLVFDAEVSTEEEYNCILIYNEEKKTITIERQSAQINLTRKIIEQQQPQIQQPQIQQPQIQQPQIKKPQIQQPQIQQPQVQQPQIQQPQIQQPQIQQPPQQPHQQQNGQMTNSPLPGTQYTTIHTPPVVVNQPAVILPEEDEFDLSKDMDEILDSDQEDSDSDQFEEIVAPTPIPPPVSSLPVTPTMPLTPSLPVTPSMPVTSSMPVTPSFHPPSPSIPLNLALPSTPTGTIVHTSSPTIVHAPSPTITVKKRKLASAPIRHPGIISPVTPMKSTNEIKRQKIDEELSSSGSEEEESSSGSESGSTESSSGESESESGSSSDDDDFESLAQDISMSLSKGGPSAPASPQRIHTPNTPGNTPTPSTRQPQSLSNQYNGAPAPMSLRALFKEEDEEEGLSSSSSDDED